MSYWLKEGLHLVENNSAYDLFYTYLSEMKCICMYKEY